MNRLFLSLVSCGTLTPAVGTAQTPPRVERDIPYAEPKDERQLLDGYAPATDSEKFGDLERQHELSAVNYGAPSRGIPPFLLLHVADHTDATDQLLR